MQNDSYNRGGYIAFLFSMIFSLAFFIYVAAIHPGIDLKEIPEVKEGATQTLAAVDVSKVENPWVSSEEMVAHGGKVYSQNCAVCHGDKGAGDGAAGLALNPRPRNFIEGKWTNGGDRAGIYEVLQKGIPGSSMASFAHLPPVDRWALVHFVRSLTKNLVKDDDGKVEAFAKTAK